VAVVADSGPLISAVRSDEAAHSLARELVAELGRELVVLMPVLAEVDYIVRERAGSGPARRLLRAIADGEHTAAFLSPGLLARAVEIDETYADLNLGFVDAAIMAYAERHELPILTFDFRHFRATKPAVGEWRLLVDERTVRRALRSATGNDPR
jgi:uncharacterized protein